MRISGNRPVIAKAGPALAEELTASTSICSLPGLDAEIGRYCSCWLPEQDSNLRPSGEQPQIGKAA